MVKAGDRVEVLDNSWKQSDVPVGSILTVTHLFLNGVCVKENDRIWKFSQIKIVEEK